MGTLSLLNQVTIATPLNQIQDTKKTEWEVKGFILCHESWCEVWNEIINEMNKNVK